MEASIAVLHVCEFFLLMHDHLQEVQKVFVHLPELYTLSVQLLASVDECMEMAGEVEGVAQCPQAGFVFEEMAEVNDTHSTRFSWYTVCRCTCVYTVHALTEHYNLTVHVHTMYVLACVLYIHTYTCVDIHVWHVEHYTNVFDLQSEEFDVYINYASTYREAVQVLENIFLKNDKAVEYLKVCSVHMYMYMCTLFFTILGLCCNKQYTMYAHVHVLYNFCVFFT